MSLHEVMAGVLEWMIGLQLCLISIYNTPYQTVWG